ncbi:Multidrug resistance protein 1 [Eumeta japonica]|uniref:Multidrug resistance protein 1 n=1 Tax=Eumeta variegata TaxID=151549 RepID=A0A4C1X891_EUMVA|nr:Multidrug resistance protein 1 [Eumeta japonica]
MISYGATLIEGNPANETFMEAVREFAIYYSLFGVVLIVGGYVATALMNISAYNQSHVCQFGCSKKNGLARSEIPRSPNIDVRYTISTQEAKNALVTPLALRTSLDDGDHLLHGGSHILLTNRKCYMNKIDPELWSELNSRNNMKIGLVIEPEIYRVRQEYLKAALNQDFEYIDVRQTGDFASKMSDDVVKLEDGIGEKIATFVYYQTTFTSNVVMALVKGWKLALLCFISFPVTLGLVGLSGFIASKLTKLETKVLGRASSVAEEVLSSVRTVYAFNGQQKELERYQVHLIEATRLNVKKSTIELILYVWWGWKGIIHCEFVPPSKTINSDLYCQTVEETRVRSRDKTSRIDQQKECGFHYDKVRPHTSLATQQILREFGWEVLMHPPHRPDLTPLDFHLFRSLQTSLGRLTSTEDY